MAFLTSCLWLVALAMPAAVAAHAELESTSPEAGSSVDGPVTVVSATFSEALEASKSSIEVLDASGASVASGGVYPDDARTLTVTVLGLPAGTYEVRWTAASDDDHLERGRFDFTVAAAPSPAPTLEPTAPATSAPIASEGATPAPEPAPTASPAASPVPEGTAGSESIGQLLVIAVVGIGIGIGIGWWRSRRAA